MSIGNTTENAILDLIFSATTWDGYAENDTTSPQTNVGLSLHTSDPGDTGSASTNEISYTSYTRINLARSTGFDAAVAGEVYIAATASFPAGTGGSGTATHFAAAASNASPPTGAQVILFSGTVTPNIVCGSGVTPQLTTSTKFTLD